MTLAAVAAVLALGNPFLTTRYDGSAAGVAMAGGPRRWPVP